MNGIPRRMRAPVVWIALAALLAPGTLLAQMEPQPVGSWVVYVSPQVPGNPVFVNLAAIHQDGTMISFPPASPVGSTFASGGVGAWRRAAANQHDVVFISTLYEGDTLVGYQRIRSTITLTRDGRQFSGAFTLEILDPDEQVIETIAGTVTARRIVM